MAKRFQLKLKTEEVEIEQEDGKVRLFTVKELTGDLRDDYITNLAKRTKYVGGRPQGMSDYKGMNSKLLALCLYDETDNLVPEKAIAGWPSSVQSELFDMAQLMSGLAKEADKEAKNE